MSAISNKNVAYAIYQASRSQNLAEPSVFFKKVIQFLVKRKLLSKTPDILECLNKIINEEDGRVVAKISSRENLNEKIKKEIVDSLTKRYSAKEIILVPSLDEKLLGGFKIEVRDEVIDLTIKNKIGELQEYLTKSA